MKKKIMAALLCGAMMCSLSACRESERVAYNISKEADNFNVTRRLEVINDLRCGGRQRRLRGQVPLRGEFPAGDDHSGYGDVA